MLDFAPTENRISPTEGILIEDADARARERRHGVPQARLEFQSAVRRLRARTLTPSASDALPRASPSHETYILL